MTRARDRHHRLGRRDELERYRGRGWHHRHRDAAHAYGTYGTYHATAHLAVGGQSAEDTFTVKVANVAPVVSVPESLGGDHDDGRSAVAARRYKLHRRGVGRRALGDVDWGDGPGRSLPRCG